MKRRDFLKSSALIGAAGALPSSITDAAESSASASREYYELRLYHLRRGPMQKRFDDYFRDAAIPALNRAGIGPIGVFSVMTGPDSPTMYVLIPYKSLDAFSALPSRLQDDVEHQKSGAAFLDATAADPAYVRVESSLMKAFGLPKLEVPALATDKKPRIFELRTYESPSKKANRKKIEMFEVGEIAIFRRTGITPVFFGESLIGSRLPNLAYMAVFENMTDNEKSWTAFRTDPEWEKLKAKPEYADSELLCNTSNVFLRPAAYSQI